MARCAVCDADAGRHGQVYAHAFRVQLQGTRRVALAKLDLTSGKRTAPPAPLATGAESPLNGGADAIAAKAKRTRTNLTIIGGVHIDSYLTTYISLSGNAAARAALFRTIIEAAATNADIDSEAWTPKIVSDRLHNTLKAKNKKEKAAAAAEAAETAAAAATETA